jgi:hypothetical protein
MTKFDDDETRRIKDELNDIILWLDRLRARLDVMTVERGIPIKNTVNRVNKAKEYAVSARDYWDHDVISGYAQQTKAEMGRTEAAELS